MTTTSHTAPARAIVRRGARSSGFTLIDAIMTLTVLAFATSVFAAYFNSSTSVDQPVQRLQRDKDFQYAIENIIADYYFNYWRSWNEAPPDDFDVCDETKPTYIARNDTSVVLTSSLMDFKEDLEADPGRYGNITVVSIDCDVVEETDSVDRAQLVMRLQSNSTATPQQMVITLGK